MNAKERFRRREQARMLGRLLLAEQNDVIRAVKGDDNHQGQHTQERLQQARDLLVAVGNALDAPQDASWELIDNAWRALKGAGVTPQPTAAPVFRPPGSSNPIAPMVASDPSPWARQSTKTPSTSEPPIAAQVDIRETAEALQLGLHARALPFENNIQHSTASSAADDALEPTPAVRVQPPSTKEQASAAQDDFSGTVMLDNRSPEDVDPLPFTPSGNNED